MLQEDRISAADIVSFILFFYKDFFKPSLLVVLFLGEGDDLACCKTMLQKKEEKS